ncbi:MAG: phage head morphogenesis protein [Treponema sp.]|jgi:uncharacterized protein with gpF-like domain|nr:phage head morphogenesis protein [Treponema sp.]
MDTVIGIIIAVCIIFYFIGRKKQKGKSQKNNIPTQKIGQVYYTEREIPDDSEEAIRIKARQEAWSKMTPAEQSKKLETETRERMQAADLKLYIWSSANDERTCSACKIMEGLLCKWTDPTVYSKNGGKTWISRPKGAVLLHPGENICEGEGYCRCTALSYWPELVGEI